MKRPEASGASDIPCWNSGGQPYLSPRANAFCKRALGTCIRRLVFWMALFT